MDAPTVTDAAELARLRRWASHPGNLTNPLACAVRILFRQVDALVDRAAEFAATEAAIKDAKARAAGWQKRVSELQTIIAGLRRSPWEESDDGRPCGIPETAGRDAGTSLPEVG